jgi:Family of unknown function (DUF5362)
MIGGECVNQTLLKGLSSWGKFLAWTLIVSGVFNALLGLFAFVVGAIPGVVTIIMGVKLLSASKSAEKLAYGEANEVVLNDLLSNYLSYFKIQGILLIISFVIMAVSFSLFGLATFAGLAELAN